MFKALLFVGILAVAASAHATSITEYAVHQQINGSSATQGQWKLDYVQLIPRAGHPLSDADTAINARLKQAALDQMCSEVDDPQIAKDSSSTQKTNVTFVSARLLAITVNYDVECADTAHPSFGATSAIYDRQLGQPIDISTGLPVGENFTTQSPGFNKIVLDAMVQEVTKQVAARRDQACVDEYQTANLTFTFDGVALSSKAISVDLDVAHVDEACGFTTVIPLAQFLPVAPKGSVLEELAKAAGGGNSIKSKIGHMLRAIVR